MARFYDTVNNADLKRVEGLLQQGGIVYTLRLVGDDSTLMKEIQVAEEDIAAAERMLCDKPSPRHDHPQSGRL